MVLQDLTPKSKLTKTIEITEKTTGKLSFSGCFSGDNPFWKSTEIGHITAF